MVMLLTAATANAGMFDPTYRPKAGDFMGQFGVNYTTGFDKDFENGTNFTSGSFNVGDVKLAYGVLDNMYVSLEVFKDPFNPLSSEAAPIAAVLGGTPASLMFTNFANPELGINWQVFGSKAFSIDVIGKYGMALTSMDIGGEDLRIGMNNFQAGARIYGEAGQFQWAVQALGQYVLLQDLIADELEIDAFTNLLLQAEAQHAFNANYAIKGGVNYDVIKFSGEDLYIYNRSVTIGMPYNFSETSSMMPYLSYHFKSVMTYDGDDRKLFDNYFQIGTKFAVRF